MTTFAHLAFELDKFSVDKCPSTMRALLKSKVFESLQTNKNTLRITPANQNTGNWYRNQ